MTKLEIHPHPEEVIDVDPKIIADMNQRLAKPNITSSHLALRFYRAAGWTRRMLEDCLVRGQLRLREDFLGELDLNYWTLDHTTHAAFNIDKLLEIAGEVYDYHGRPLEGKERLEYVSKMNW